MTSAGCCPFKSPCLRQMQRRRLGSDPETAASSQAPGNPPDSSGRGASASPTTSGKGMGADHWRDLLEATRADGRAGKQDGVVDHFAGSGVSMGRVLGDFLPLAGFVRPPDPPGFVRPVARPLCLKASLNDPKYAVQRVFRRQTGAVGRTNAAVIDTMMRWI